METSAPASGDLHASDAAATAGPPPAAGVAVFERRAFERALAARVLKPQHWAKLEELDNLLERVNALYDEVEADLARARDAGQAAGFAEGLRRAQEQMTQQLTLLNERRARVLGEAAGRISELACAIVARVAPGFDAAAVVPPLVMQAVEAAQAEQFLLIRVHPDVRAPVQAGLGAVRQAHPAVGVIELVDDESLDPLSCVVVSEAGEVRAGVAQQIEAIRVALAGVGAGGAG